ncbi:carotenoid biosynthesis protein [Paenibacillus sp. RS8]|uniref:carotenoid biosynthesis protein n=1 Tax=Paenibacillus sp. RS8 TaxID=3242681 RepID=UPI0035BFF15E
MIRILFWIWYFIGALLLIWLGIPESLQFSNGLFLIFYAAYAADLIYKGLKQPIMSDQSVIRKCKPTIWVSAILIWTLGMIVEWIGVHSGKLFGTYDYSDILGPLLYGVPITLGFAWIAVIYNATLISYDFGLRGLQLRLAKALQIGFWTVLLDLVLDPVAHARGFWHWGSSGGFYGVPWSNFVGWFIVGIILSLTLINVKSTSLSARNGTRLYQAILVLFGTIGLCEGLLLCGVIAVLGALLAEGSLRYVGSRQTQRV